MIIISNIEERFLLNNIPYSAIDGEMIKIIDILNFNLGLKTQFCCFGHEAKDDFHIIFDKIVNENKLRI